MRTEFKEAVRQAIPVACDILRKMMNLIVRKFRDVPRSGIVDLDASCLRAYMRDQPVVIY